MKITAEQHARLHKRGYRALIDYGVSSNEAWDVAARRAANDPDHCYEIVQLVDMPENLRVPVIVETELPL